MPCNRTLVPRAADGHVRSLVIESSEDFVGLLRISFFEGVRVVYVGTARTYQKDSYLV